MKQYTLFYSWQSDDKESKRIIQKALNKAVDSLKKEGIEIYIDQDTRDRTGSANINRRVIEKIESCDIFVADLTPVYTLPKNEEIDSLPKHMPNSNVLFEYGYAQKTKGFSHFISLALLKKGEHIEYMPFDINHDTITPFSSEKDLSLLDKWIKKITETIDKENATRKKFSIVNCFLVKEEQQYK